MGNNLIKLNLDNPSTLTDNHHSKIMKEYNEILVQILELHESIDKQYLTPETYLYSMEKYQKKLFESIKKTENSIYIQDTINIHETLFNIVIVTLNYLQIQDPSKTHISITTENKELFEKKNNDYGNSFEDFKLIGVLVRLNDKINRLITILKDSTTQKVNESLTDTLNDLYNYGIIGLMYKTNN